MLGEKRASGQCRTGKTHESVGTEHLGPRVPPFYILFTPIPTHLTGLNP